MSTPAERFSVFLPWSDRSSSLDARRRYAVAILAVAAAAALRLAIAAVGQRFLFTTFFMALFVSAWYGGFGPTILALVLSLVTVYLSLLPGERTFDLNTSIASAGALLFALIGLATAWMGETRLRAFRRSEEHARLAAEALRAQLGAEAAVRSLQRLESVGQLAGGVAHEVNNQMTVVLGAADFILRRDDVPAPVRADVEVMRDAAQRSAGITAQLLAFGRRQILRPEVVDLSAVVAEFQPVLRRTMGERYELAYDLAPHPARVRADRRQLEQVLLNLALNAGDAMPEGGRLSLQTARVELTAPDARLPLEPSVRPGSYVEFAMTDQGTGMDEATLERIFEPFFSTKGTGKGSGLGLSMVYGIIRQSGGYIAVRSVVGRGTTFVVYLPVTSEAPSSASNPRASRAMGGSETVLVVEDQPEVRQMAVRALQSEGYVVIEASDGQQALELAGDGTAPIALVITDLALPRLDGLGLARELATVMPGVPVLFMTGHTSSDSMRRSALVRGHPLLEKPFTADELGRRVRSALDARTP